MADSPSTATPLTTATPNVAPPPAAPGQMSVYNEVTKSYDQVATSGLTSQNVQQIQNYAPNTTPAPTPAPVGSPAPSGGPQPVQYPANAQGFTSPEQMSTYAGQLADQRASQDKKQAIDTAASLRPPGTIYDQNTGTYKDPLSGQVFLGYSTGKVDPATGQEVLSQTPTGQDPSQGMRFGSGTSWVPQVPLIDPVTRNPVTPEQRNAINSMFNVSGGAVTTDAVRTGVNALGQAITQIQQVPLNLQDTTLPPEIQKALQPASAYDQLAAEGIPWAAEASRMEAARAAAIGDIHTRAGKQIEDQNSANKQALGQAQVMMANLGTLGSTQAGQYIADTIARGDRAIRDIQDSERQAVNEAQAAFDDKQFAMAKEKYQYAMDARTQAIDLAFKQADLKMQYSQYMDSRQEKQLQLQREYKQDQQDTFTMYAKANMDPNMVPTQAYGDFAKTFGLKDAQSAKDFYTQSLQASQSKDYNERLITAMNAAKLVTNPNATIAMPTATGGTMYMKRNEIQIPSDYDQFTMTQDGKKFAVYVDKSKVKVGADGFAKIPIGEDEGKKVTITAADGSVWDVDKTNPKNNQMIFDAAGRPVAAQTAVFNFDQGLQGQGSKYDYSSSSSHAPGTTGSSISYRTNNPGNIKFGSWAKSMGGVDSGIKAKDGGSFALFPSYEAGQKAQLSLLQSKNYSSLTVEQAMRRWSNNGYGADVTEGTIAPNKKMSDLTPDELNTLQTAMQSREGFYPDGSSGAKVPVGMNSGGRSPESDNLMAASIYVNENADVKNYIQSGTVTKIDNIGVNQDKTPLYSVTVRDTDTGHLVSFYGLKDTKLNVGSAWGKSQMVSAIGTAGSQGVSMSLRNADNSPMKPVSLPSTLSEAKAQYASWGQSGLSLLASNKAVWPVMQSYISQLEKGGKLENVVDSIKNDPVLSRYDSSSYFGRLYDAASIGDTVRKNREISGEKAQKQLDLAKSRDTRYKISNVQATSPSMDLKPMAKAITAMKAPFVNIQEAFRQAQTAKSVIPANTLLDEFARMMKGGSMVIPQNLVDRIENSRSWAQKFDIQTGQIFGDPKSLVLTEDEKKDMLSTASEVMNTMIQQQKDQVAAITKAVKDKYPDVADTMIEGELLSATQESLGLAPHTIDGTTAQEIQQQVTALPDGATFTIASKGTFKKSGGKFIPVQQ